MSRVLVEKETIYTEEVNMLMKGATYTEVIEYMESQDDSRRNNPFAAMTKKDPEPTTEAVESEVTVEPVETESEEEK